jgi:uncharacterized repeat protein (TIGR01451 family)/MYXO-CTERM domain-containing protein
MLSAMRTSPLLGFAALVFALPLETYAQDIGVSGVAMPAPDACGVSQQDVVVTLTNPTQSAITNVPVSAVITGATPAMLSATVAGPVPANGTLDATIGPIDTFNGGTVGIDVTTALPNDTNPANDNVAVSIPISPGRVPIVAMPAVCPGTTATIQVGPEPSSAYAWFNVATGGAAVAMGASFTTPALTAMSTYYVERLNNIATVGLPNMSAGTGAYLSPDLRSTDPYGLIFNVINTVTLTSVTIYTNGAGNVVVRLLSDRVPQGGTVLQTANAVAPAAGAVTIPLNFTIPPGTGYVLDLLGTVPTVFRINSGVTYPMTSTDGNLVITGQTFNTTNTYYYWFFDWQLGTEGCADERTSVVVDVDPNACMADLQVTAVGPPTTFRGGTVTLSSQIDNLGPDIATSVNVTATPPAGLNFVSNTGGCNTPFPCALGNMDGNTTATIDSTYAVPANYAGPALLAFNIDATTTETDPDGTNNGATVMVPVVEPVDLSVQVTSSTSAQGGLPLSYDVIVTNAGPGEAVNTTLALPLDPLFTGATTTGCAEDPAGVPSCSLGNIPAGGSQTVTVVATTNDDTTGTVTLSGTAQSDSPESVPGNDTGSITRFIELISDLSIAVSSAPSTIVPGGDPVVFTVVVTNQGPSASSGGVVTTTLPSELTSPVTSGCVEDPQGVPTCTLANAPSAAGSSTQFTITDDVPSGATGSPSFNVVVVSNDTDGNAGNDTAGGTIPLVPQSDLLLGIVPPREEVVSGGPVTFEVLVTNNGPSDATNVSVALNAPPELTMVTTVGCNEDPAGAPTCGLGTMLPGERSRIEFTGMVAGSATADFTTRLTASADAVDPLPGSNTNTMTLTPTIRSDVVVTLTGPAAVETGDAATFNLRVEAGPADAADVVATFTLPDELTLMNTAGCDNDPNGAPRCELGTVSASVATDVTLVLVGGEVATDTEVTVSVVATTSSDGNDTTNDSGTVTLQVLPPTDVDLSLVAELDATEAEPGDTGTLTLTPANAGPGAATNVVVAVTLPDGVTIVESRGCFEDPSATDTCTIGLLNPDRNRPVRFDFTVDDDASGALTFSGSVTSDSDEAGPGDESDSVILMVAGDEPDAGVSPDGGGMIGTRDDDGGCGCNATAQDRGGLWVVLLLAPIFLRRRR